jgi:hypothetical protein
MPFGKGVWIMHAVAADAVVITFSVATHHNGKGIKKVAICVRHAIGSHTCWLQASNHPI